jgi:hypothetical protein
MMENIFQATNLRRKIFLWPFLRTFMKMMVMFPLPKCFPRLMIIAHPMIHQNLNHVSIGILSLVSPLPKPLS